MAKRNNNNFIPSNDQLKRLMNAKPVAPSAAVSKPGQKPTTPLRQRTPQEKNTPYIRPSTQKTFDALNWAGKTAAETVALGAAGKIVANPVTKIAASKIGKAIGGRTAAAAYQANTKGLAAATGAGGKISRTVTPMGPTLRSTAIGTAKQQAARINNLEQAAFLKATRAGAIAQTKAIVDTIKVAKKIQKGLGITGAGASAYKNRPNK